MLKVKRLTPEAILPTVAHPGEDAAYDLYTPRDITCPAHKTTRIPIEIAIEAEDIFTGSSARQFGDMNVKTALIFKDRSSISSKTGLFTRGGVCDNGYRGPIFVSMHNLYDEDYTFKAGERVAQMVPVLTLTQEVVESDELSDSARGTKGFGSSGK